MGLFRRTSEPDTEERSFSFQQLAMMTGDSSASGVVTDTDGALRNAAVWACVDLLAGSVSALPVDAVRPSGDVRMPVSPTPPLLSRPSATSTLDVWMYQLMWSMLTDGNAFGLITATDARSWPTTIELLDPDKVRERKVKDGRASVSIDEAEPLDLWPRGPVFHVPGKMTRPGSPYAMSPLQYAGRSIGTGLAAEKFGSGFFTDGGHPSALIYSDNNELTPEQAKGIKTAFVNATTGREPAVLGSGLKYEAVQVDPKDSQFLELMRFEVEQICRFYRVPPSMVYGAVSGQAVTYANVSQADLHYLKHSLDGYLVRIERALTDLLPRPQVVKFNRDALLRTDTLSRYEAHAIALTNQFMSVDEVRELEDRPPMPEPQPPEVPNDSPS